MEAVMRKWFPVAVVVLASAAPAWAQSGLTIHPDQVPWPKLQARIGLATPSPLVTDLWGAGSASNVQAGRVLGDYYFLGHGLSFGSAHISGAFRATSGVLLGANGPSLSMSTVPQFGWSVSAQQQPLGAQAQGWSDPDTNHGLPYVGVGYTGLSLKGGWGFTADVGVLAMNPGSGLRITKQSLDDTLRDLRVTPVVQLGVSYSF
jgi:hypothetical protein